MKGWMTRDRSTRQVLPPEVKARALAALFLATARPGAWTLGAIYLALATAKPFLYTASAQAIATLQLVDATVAVGYFLVGTALLRATHASRWAQPAGGGWPRPTWWVWSPRTWETRPPPPATSTWATT